LGVRRVPMAMVVHAQVVRVALGTHQIQEYLVPWVRVVCRVHILDGRSLLVVVVRRIRILGAWGYVASAVSFPRV
ncbi:MAG: hypothetical protein ACRCT2_05270, partial [Plesiomonas shigelloides]